MEFTAKKRIVYHTLLAVFLANAANRFFIPDLDFELEHRFYQRIFEGVGDAPDQYRILPLLALKAAWSLLKALHPGTPWNHAVLLFNGVFGFLVLEGFYRLATFWSSYKRLVFNFIFASTYIYTQYTGWRPDTLGLELASVLSVWVWQEKAGRPVWSLPALVALAFCRTDVALVFAAFQALYLEKQLWMRVVLVAIPLVTQWLLQTVLFPAARYYTHTMMLFDNLGGYYLAYNPATWGLLAALLLFWNDIRAFALRVRANYPWLPWMLAGYAALVLVVGRINEYRLYLPFVPLLLYAAIPPDQRPLKPGPK